MIRPWPTKDPDANLRYYFDWRTWLPIENGGVIESFEIFTDEGDAALLNGGSVEGTNAFAGVIMVWLSGGTLDSDYTVRCRVTLTDGTTEDASRTLRIAQH